MFSRSLKLLDCIQNFLCMKYPLLRYNGGMTKKERQAVEKTFNEDRNIFVMLMTVGAGSVGLNLTAANVVVLFDPHWNPAVDAQAQVCSMLMRVELCSTYWNPAVATGAGERFFLCIHAVTLLYTQRSCPLCSRC